MREAIPLNQKISCKHHYTKHDYTETDYCFESKIEFVR